MKLVSKLTAIAVRHLPELWHLPQERLAAMQSIAPQCANLVLDANHALADIVQDFTNSLRFVRSSCSPHCYLHVIGAGRSPSVL